MRVPAHMCGPCLFPIRGHVHILHTTELPEKVPQFCTQERRIEIGIQQTQQRRPSPLAASGRQGVRNQYISKYMLEE